MSSENKLRPAAFIDRDGVINEERNYVHQIDDFVFLPGAIHALRRLQDMGFLLVVVTNQAGIARGFYSLAQFDKLTNHMKQELRLGGVTISGIYYCPHHPNGAVKELAIDCDCRKPRPGMLLTAAKELGLDLAKSVLVGDKHSDILAGQSAGVPINILVESGHVCENEARSLATTVCMDLASAAYWIEMRYSPLAISRK
jgi:D-glycero-D-manno-heptose 1,7-bisphosphate phosphatase